MSGHSKWSTIKRKKSAMDAKRGALFTKIGREIEIAAREGADPETNFKLRLVVEKARSVNMPKENIERAIRRGAGLEKGSQLEKVMYEAYAPHGVALIIEALTDNRNRTVAELRRVFNRMGGSLGESGSVSWLFEEKGYIAVDPRGRDPEEVALVAIEAGADDVVTGDRLVEVYTLLEDFKAVQSRLIEAGFTVSDAQLALIPKTMVDLPPAETIQVMRVIDAIEELDDVANVYSNLNIPDKVLAQYESEAA
jgi:YebC/PmpR family DNA-binding regulatory protein